MKGKKIAISRKILVKKGPALIEVPFETVKSIFADVGFSGELLMKATIDVFHQATRLGSKGVVSIVDFEKAVVNAIRNTNNIAANTTKKIMRRFVK